MPYNYGDPIGIASCNNVTYNSVYFVSASGGVSNIPDFPWTGKPGWLVTCANGNQTLQYAYAWQNYSRIKFRCRTHGTWGIWIEIATDLGTDFNIELNTYRSTTDGNGIICEWDDNKKKHHIHGTLTANNVFKNVFVGDFSLPVGMKPGETYYVWAPIDGEILASTNVLVQIYVNKNTSTASWQTFKEFWANGAPISFTIPNDAVGLLARYNVFGNGTSFDFYSKINVVSNIWNNSAMTRQSFLTLQQSTYSDLYPSSCDDINMNSLMFNSHSDSESTFSDFPFSTPGWIWTYLMEGGHNIQFAMDWYNGAIKYRISHFGTWQNWMKIPITGLMLDSCDLDDVYDSSGFYLLTDDKTYENKPLASLNAGYLQVEKAENWTLQIFYHLTDNRVWKRSIWNGSVTGAGWVQMGGGGGATYNITQEINRDNISNTYNITTSPTITTGTNDYIRAIDNESTSEANATDMTGAIMSMLNSTGHCKLGPGVFYVSGSIDMPNGSMLEGCGDKTIVRLLSSVNSGYIVRIKQYNTIKDIHFSGGTSLPTNLFTDGTNMGSRHGIYMIANADGHEASQPATAQCVITNCWFDNFDGSAFYAHNTGGGIHNSVIFSDSHIEHCRVGLNIDYYNEYAKYSHLVIFQCYYACINNGGNNIFTGCTFHGVVGWLTDNSNNDKSNNQHGSCVGCTFNHIDSMNHPDVLGNGKAVHIINGVAGFIFTGCQLWYGNVKIENSEGVQFSDNLFGNNGISIEVTGSWPAFFFNNIFWTQPTINVTPSTKFEGNYLKTGTEVVA